LIDARFAVAYSTADLSKSIGANIGDTERGQLRGGRSDTLPIMDIDHSGT
jgi:hypothetical protein